MADEATAPPPAAAAGAMLAQAREEAALSIDTVAAQLKLAPRQVRALESGDFAALPGRTFVRGFVRNYARLLDIDADRVLGALPADDEPGLAHPHLASTHRVMGEIPAEHVRSRSFAGWAIALALVAIVAAAVLYEMFRPQWPSGEPVPKADKPAASAPAPEAPDAAAPAPAEGRTLPNPVAPATPGPASPSSGAGDNETKVASASAPADTRVASAAPADSIAAKSAPPVAPTPPPVAAPASTSLTHVPPAAPAAAAAAAPATAATLQIIFRGTSWLDVKDAKGVSLLTMTGNEGATRTLDAAPPLDLVVGNADHVDIVFRGEHVDLAPHARQNVARLQLR